jgi:membrane associated rhomboid family serine protease
MVLINYFLIANIAVSYFCLQDKQLFYKLSLSPYRIKHHREWYRIFTHAFVHADFFHLFINMFVLYNFGGFLEKEYGDLFGDKSTLLFLLLYLGGIIFSTFTSMKRHQDNPDYNAVGASGVTSAIVFSFIAIHPGKWLYLFLLIPIPAFVFGVMYVIYEAVMDKRGQGNIAHDAHFWGAVFGFSFTMLMDMDLFPEFLHEIQYFLENL